MGIQIVANVDAGDVAQRTRLYMDAGAISVTPAPEPDGQFSLIIVFADSPDPAQPFGGGGPAG